jgi:hypothetical protein
VTEHDGPVADASAAVLVLDSGLAQGTVFPPDARHRAPSAPVRDIRCGSAGCLSAALLAAAEYGEGAGGDRPLEELDAWLADESHLRSLFQPSAATKPLFAALLAFARRERVPQASAGLAAAVAGLWSLVPRPLRIAFDAVPGALRDALPWHYWGATAVGMVIGGTVDVLLARGLVDASHPVARAIVAFVLPVMFIGAYLASAGLCAWRLWRIARKELARRGDGLCTGLGDERTLTPWLHERLQALAGLRPTDPPLTCGMLRSKAGAGEWHCVTSSLDLPRPVLWPEEASEFLIRETDARDLFPETIVDHLLRMASTDADPTPNGYLRLPAAGDLPVLVVARIATDLPVLLRAVPLFHRPSARLVVFGRGMSVHSPAQLLEAWLPVRPGFGLSSTQAARGDSMRWIAMAEAARLGSTTCEELSTEVLTASDSGRRA